MVRMYDWLVAQRLMILRQPHNGGRLLACRSCIGGQVAEVCVNSCTEMPSLLRSDVACSLKGMSLSDSAW